MFPFEIYCRGSFFFKLMTDLKIMSKNKRCFTGDVMDLVNIEDRILSDHSYWM